MSGSAGPKTCCDSGCAYFNDCYVGGIECNGCGRYFCSGELNEDGYCDDCEAELNEDDETKGEDDEE